MPATPAQLTAFATAVTTAATANGITGVVTLAVDGVQVLPAPILVATPLAMIAGKPADFSGASNVYAGPAIAPPVKPVLNTNPATVWSASTSKATLQNVVIDSADGNGYGGNVSGSNVTLNGVDFHNLSDGLHLSGCKGLTINGGSQTGAVKGRCLFFLDVHGLTMTGGVYGPASTQSPLRFSAPGTFGDPILGSTITGVCSTQVGSPFPIATWAIHAMQNMTLVDCWAIGGEFSFDGAGEGGPNDVVSGNTIKNLTTVDTKVHIDNVATSNTFLGGTFINLTGECFSGVCNPGSKNVIDGATMLTRKHGLHLYTGSDLVVRNCTLYTDVPNVPMIDGAFVPVANDGGNNTVKVIPPAQFAAMIAAMRAKIPVAK